MFELELHEWLPYLLSIGWICAVAGIYTVNLRADGAIDRMRMRENDLPLPVETQSMEIAMSFRKRLVRYVKRKDAPEEDDSDCSASLALSKTNQRGGNICQRKHLIHPARTGSVYFSSSLLVSVY